MSNIEQFARKCCTYCGGHGFVFKNNATVGRAMRKYRMEHSVGVRELAKAWEKSPSYVVHLEAGRSKWNEERVSEFQALVLRILREGEKS